MKRIAMFLAFFVLGLQLLMAQTVQITGTVTSKEDGQPLPGASVLVKGTTVGTTTDFNGKYTLNIPSDAQTLVISFVGMKAMEVAVAGQTTIDAVLESDAVGLEEVVVTALGMSKSKKALGYAVSEFKSEDMERGQIVDATRALQGRIAGVNITSSSGAPGASTSVIVRGLSSITQSNQPLYIIDGVPVNNQYASGNSTQAATTVNMTVDFGNAASDINPADIETMTVLKGAAATSLYGSRAANGAIIVTTKGGKLNQKMRVDFASSATLTEVGRLPYYQDVYGQGWNGSFNSQENGSWGPALDGKLRLSGNVVDNTQRLIPFTFQENGLRDFYEYGYGLNNSIALSGGGEKIAYYASYANAKQDGVLPGNGDVLDRNSLTFKANGGTDKTKINFATSFTNKKISAAATGQGDDAGAGKAVYQELMQNPNNHYIPLYRDYNNKFDNLDNFYTAYGQNPYFVINENGNDFEQNRIISSLDLSHQFTQHFKVIWRGGVDHFSNFYKRYGAIARITPGSPNSSANDVAGMTQEEGRTVSQLNSDFLVNYLNVISMGSGKLEYDITVGHNVNSRYNKRLTTIANGLVVPNYYNVKNIKGSADVSGREFKRRVVGLYGTLSLNLNDYLFLQLAGRNDWSSTLPKDKNSFFYPGANLSWVFSEFLPDNRIVSFGKLRVGYALAGNDAPEYSLDPFYRAAEIRNGGYGISRYPVAGNAAFEKNNQLGNPDLKSELSKEFEIGIDVRFLNNRIGIDAAYYNKVTTDLIFDATIASSSGFTLITTNLGQITNSGIELSLNLVPLKIGQFEWDITYIFTKSNTILDKLAPELGVSEYVINSAYETEFVAIPGEQLGQFRIPDYKYTNDGKIVVGDNGLPLEGDKVLYGSSVPDFKMSAINTFSYKGISFSFLVDYQKGGYMYSNTANSMFWSGNSEQSVTNNRRPWVIPNSVQNYVLNADGTESYTENSTPVLNNWHEYYSSNTNKPIDANRMVEKTYIKLREMSLTYSLPKSFVQKLRLTSASIGIFGTNLLLWTPASNSFIDPETTTFGNDIESLFGEFDGAPSVRSYGIKLNLSF
jgi:TonB-linked SusC/RagA family outer membrane protein